MSRYLINSKGNRRGSHLAGELWTTEEMNLLQVYYKETDPSIFSVCHIAGMLNKTVDAVYIRASRMGLGNQGRTPNDSTRENLSRSKKDKFERDGSGHNKGKKFGPHSAEWKANVSAKMKAAWDSARASRTGLMADGNLQRHSDRMAERQAGGELRQGYSRSRAGKREDIGIYVRSGWEANIARYLIYLKSINLIDNWDYEKETFQFDSIKRGTRSYTPDFRVWHKGAGEPEYWEVKGWMDQKSRTKLDRMARFFPSIRILLIEAKEYRRIREEFGSVIGNWE